MKAKADDARDELIARYLLGGLTPVERARLEEEFFADDDLFEHVTLVEDELFDAYVRGRLDAADRARFESHLLADPRRRRRVTFATDLRDALGPAGDAAAQAAPPSARAKAARTTPLAFLRRPAFAFSLAAVSLALLTVVVWVAFERGRRGNAQPEGAVRVPTQTTLTPSPHPTQAERAGGKATGENHNAPAPPNNSGAPPTEQRASQPAQRGGEGTSPARRPDAAVATLLLSSASRDAGGTANRLTVPAGTKYVRLLIKTGEGNVRRGYSAEVETIAGRGVWSGRVARTPSSQRGLVSVTVPAAELQTGGYILKLRGPGAEEAGEYYFAVVKPAP